MNLPVSAAAVRIIWILISCTAWISPPIILKRAGGAWADATYCGSRCRQATVGRVSADANIGGRGKSKEL